MNDYIAHWRVCPVCGEVGFSETHRCPPVFICTTDDGSREVYALDPISAAEKFVEDNYADMCTYYTEYVVVSVLDPKTNTESIVQVDIEVMPRFHGIVLTEED